MTRDNGGPGERRSRQVRTAWQFQGGRGGWPVPGTGPGNPSGPASITGAALRPVPSPGLGKQALRQAVRMINAAIDDQSAGADPDEAAVLIETEVRAWLKANAGRIPVTAEAQRQLVQAVHAERFGLGPLQELIEDDQIENIDVNGCDEVWIAYADGRLEQGNPVADSDEHLVEMIRRWGAYQGQNAREFSDAQPILRLALADGSRLTAVMGVTPRPSLSVRRHRLIDIGLDDLVAYRTIDPPMRAFLGAAVRAKKNIMVTGVMDSGKTTFLRALFSDLPSAERLVTIENEYELHLHWIPHRHANVVPLEARLPNHEGRGGIAVAELIRLAFRLNARRILVGEVLGDELLAMLTAMQHGGEGSACTMHANHAGEVFNRMAILAASGPPTGLAQPENLFRLAGAAVDFVVHLDRTAGTAADGRPVNERYVAEVLEVLPPGDTIEPARTEVYVPGPDGRAVPRHMPQCAEDLVTRGGLDPVFFPAVWGHHE